jgi:hypothetical protein
MLKTLMKTYSLNDAVNGSVVRLLKVSVDNTSLDIRVMAGLLRQTERQTLLFGSLHYYLYIHILTRLLSTAVEQRAASGIL